MPSVRRLAIELGIHFNTVGEAYRTIAAEGWLDLQHGRGATVIERGARQPAGKEQIREFHTELRALVARMRAAGIPAERVAGELCSLAESLKP